MKRLVLVVLLFVIIALAVFIAINQSQQTMFPIGKKVFPTSYIFQTFVRGEVCGYRFGSDPNVLDTRCRYWILDSQSGKLSPLSFGHPYFEEIYKEQRRSNELFEKGLTIGGCAETESESICTKAESENDENKFLITRGPKNGQAESVWIKTLKSEEDSKIISNIKRIGCDGQISAWSDKTGDILFDSRWDGTPMSPSGEMLKSICIYNYKTSTLVHKKTLPVDRYGNYVTNITQGKIFLLDQANNDNGGRRNNSIIDFRKNKEETLPFPENSYLLSVDGTRVLFHQNLVLYVKETPRMFYLHPYDIKNKKSLSVSEITRASGAEDERAGLYFVSLSKDGVRLILGDKLVNSQNTPANSNCFYEVNLMNSDVKKLICGYQFQELYPGMNASDFNQFIYGEFLDWN